MSWVLLFCNVTLVNLILSGDNALAISMAAGRLPVALRRRAIAFGSVIAILSLILFVIVGSFVIQWPILKGVAGGVLVWIALHLALEHMKPVTKHQEHLRQPQKLWKAVAMIALADLTMELDNAMAMLGAADGKLSILLPSLLVTIPFLIFGSRVIAAVLNKFPWVILVAATYITWIAGSMIAEDPLFASVSWQATLQWMAPLLAVLLFFAIVGINRFKLQHHNHSVSQ